MLTASLHLTSRDFSLPHFQNGTAIFDSHHVFLQRHFVDCGSSATRPAYLYHYYLRPNPHGPRQRGASSSDRRRQPLRRAASTACPALTTSGGCTASIL